MHKGARIFIPLVIIIAIILWLTVFRQKENPNELLISGNIEAIDARLSFRIPGRLTERLVTEGDTVTAGQLIAHLESIDQEIAVAKAEAGLSLAKAVLDELLAGSRPEDIARMEAQVEQARAKLDELVGGSRAQE
ncbi:MAG TPA: biotin/lipoyl-binding protein, partial [Firmicutes bacterium]|nr:biotin/lipoyl-binding protein [Bacillota bacterium]